MGVRVCGSLFELVAEADVCSLSFPCPLLPLTTACLVFLENWACPQLGSSFGGTKDQFVLSEIASQV